MIETQPLKDAIDLRDLAGQYTDLKRESRNEVSGPCPKCGGRDRFHCQAQLFMCRHCHPRWGDAIEYVQWMGLAPDFTTACDYLGNFANTPVTHVQGTNTHRTPFTSRPGPEPTGPDSDWKRRANHIVTKSHQVLLYADSAEPGRQYLKQRGLDIMVAKQFYLGFRSDVPVPGTKGQVKCQAIVIPWFNHQGDLTGVRYRLLNGNDGAKKTSERGSQFSGILFGRHLLDDYTKAHKTLLLVEGEMNAMSCWAVANETNLDVLSYGSENSRLTPNAMELVNCYAHIIVWADREDVARSFMTALPKAVGLKSPRGQDANDLLIAGLLGGFLSAARLRNLADDRERSGLLWNLWDAAHYRADGVDHGTAEMIERIARELHLEAPIIPLVNHSGRFKAPWNTPSEIPGAGR